MGKKAVSVLVLVVVLFSFALAEALAETVALSKPSVPEFTVIERRSEAEHS